MENIFNKSTQTNDHLRIAQANYEMTLSYPDEYWIVRDNISRRVLSLVGCSEPNNIYGQDIYDVNSKTRTNEKCKIINIEELRLNRKLDYNSQPLDFIEYVNNPEIQEYEVTSLDKYINTNLNNNDLLVNNILELDNPTNDEISKTTKLFNQLKELNPHARINIKRQDWGEQIISSVDMDLLRMPQGFLYDQINGLVDRNSIENNLPESYDIEVKKSSTVDVFYSDDESVSEDFLRDSYSRYVDAPEVTSFVFKNDKINAEVIKTDKQNEQIDDIIEQINIERAARGQEDLYINHDFVHLIDKKIWQETRPNTGACYEQREQCIYMSESESGYKTELLLISGHELKHASDYNAMQYKKEGKRSDVYRVGLQTMCNFNPHYQAISEANTQNWILRMAENRISNSPIYADELMVAKRIICERSDNETLDSKRKKAKKGNGLFDKYDNLRALADNNDSIRKSIEAHWLERKTLDKMAGLLSKYSGESKDQIEKMFDNVATLDDSSPIINLMERSLGKGAFQELGKNSMTPKDFAEFVDKMPKMKRKETINKVKENIKQFIENTFKKLFGGFKKKKLV